MSSDIINRANSYIKQDHASIEELLKSIYDDKITIEKQKEETQKNLNQIELLRKSLEQDQSELLQKQQKMIEDAKAEARDILFSAKEEANEIIQELNKEQLDSKKANQLRNKLNDKIKEVGQSVNVGSASNIDNYISKEDVCEGLEVWVPSLQNVGVILSRQVNKNDEVLVQVGLAKINLKLNELSLANSNGNIKEHGDSIKTSAKLNNSFEHGKVTTNQDSKTKFISPEINVIGQNVEDAIYVIDKYLDNCAISGMSPVRIVHGKGTGKLREGVHQYLKKNSHVKSFRLGTFGEGEMGVTVVELK